jgi:dolichyl-phosphate-mannose--protein O-mannosyl transferase
LAKLLIALVGWIFGFEGDFDFKEIGRFVFVQIQVGILDN